MDLVLSKDPILGRENEFSAGRGHAFHVYISGLSTVFGTYLVQIDSC